MKTGIKILLLACISVAGNMMGANAQKQIMRSKGFGKWDELVRLYTQFLEVELPKADKKGLIHGVPLRTYNYREWTKDDLLKLATFYNSSFQFETLILLKNIAVSAPNGKLSQNDITNAQAALQHLKPDACKSWKTFFNWIADVEEATVSKRAAIKMKRESRK